MSKRIGDAITLLEKEKKLLHCYIRVGDGYVRLAKGEGVVAARILRTKPEGTYEVDIQECDLTIVIYLWEYKDGGKGQTTGG